MAALTCTSMVTPQNYAVSVSMATTLVTFTYHHATHCVSWEARSIVGSMWLGVPWFMNPQRLFFPMRQSSLERRTPNISSIPKYPEGIFLYFLYVFIKYHKKCELWLVESRISITVMKTWNIDAIICHRTRHLKILWRIHALIKKAYISPRFSLLRVIL